ncbi:MAG TPA: prepilin-type N-terminal cleavage/methylation domain-containing protein [Phycisphaerae bacterium]|nr:prepilin-type N-terminal cleavage/methylation domain-containing protein [Phycisphaerae bacterium]HRY69903.1 prepilin-type N-terminal cleavage/methylation domain-containing protein [Phycisphaerae bacterium]HSA27111.1 prepilin-type N-terminal cleavage/methylation domain-containing protein [Phycisphaerae bacterium]
MMGSFLRLRAARAFTLIEVLVVVAIIAVLLAILIPSLNRVRAQGRTVKCQTHERQFGVAANVFVAEHRSRILRAFGTYNVPVGANLYNWVNHVARLMGDKRARDGAYITELVEKYEVFQCPERTITHPDDRFLDYAINGLDHRGPLTRAGIPDPVGGMWIEVEGVSRIDLWKQPSRVIYIMDGASELENPDLAAARRSHEPTAFDVWHAGHLPVYGEDRIGERARPRSALQMHPRGSSAVFVDGHVEQVRPPARPGGAKDPADYICQWYMKKFGVERASTEQPVIKAIMGAPYGSGWESWYYRISVGDPFYRP